MEIHEFAEAFPALPEPELQELAEDIRANGLREAITLYEGAILDGRNRYAACQLAEVEPRFKNLPRDWDAMRWVISANIKRRHLNESQRAMVAARLANLPQGRPEAKPAHGRVSQEEAASLLNVGERTVQRAGAVLRSEDADLIAAVDEGIIPVREAEQLSRGEPEYRQRVIEEVREQEVPARTAARRIRDDQAWRRRAEEERRRDRLGEVPVPDPDLRQGDFREVLDDVRDVDLVFTDPPYPREFLPLWDELGAWAAQALKPGAKLVTYSGQQHLPDVLSILSKHLTYEWLGWLAMPGPTYQPRQRPVYSNGKPLLFFSRPPIARRPRYSDVQLAGGRVTELHGHGEGWQQDGVAALYYISTLTDPGALVVDPFLGTGTFGLAAKVLGRRFVGAEIEQEEMERARVRIA